MITAPAPDITYHGQAYRLAEPGRENGASVRVVDCTAIMCCCCPKPLPVAGKAVRMADRIDWCHIGCAIRCGDLVPADRVAQARRASV